MEPGPNIADPDEQVDPDFLMGLIQACFSPHDGTIRPKPEWSIVTNELMLKLYLRVAADSGLDPKALYEKAVADLTHPGGAPSYVEIAPKVLLGQA